jgi:hypothetical protein
MVKGLTQTSSIVSIGFSTIETAANTFTQSQIDLNLSPLDREVFVALGVNLDPYTPDSVAGSDSDVRAALTATSNTVIVGLNNSNCIAASQNAIRASGFLDSGVSFQSLGSETPAAQLDYLAIIATSDFYVGVVGRGNLLAKGVTGKLYGYRARASADIFAALVQSEVLSA